MPTNLAALVGNGLSIAYNTELTLGSITDAVIERMEAWDGPDSMEVVKAIARRVVPTDDAGQRDFEALVGAFGFEERTLRMLLDLASNASSSDIELLNAIEIVAKYARKVRDAGLSFVLEVIAERSRFNQSEPQPIDRFVAATTDERWGNVVFGNLNYDTLLLAELLRSHLGQVADMGRGWESREFELGGQILPAQQLRPNLDEFPDYRIKLLHLHGSMAYWRENPDSPTAVKLPRECVESPAVWALIRDGRTEARPMVVLASQKDKTSHVDEFPFNVCYQGFAQALDRSENWLIAGYSFRDEPVNSMLRSAFLKRDPKPHVLVVTLGEGLKCEAIQRTLGWGSEDSGSGSWLSVFRGGIDAMPTFDDWINSRTGENGGLGDTGIERCQ